MSTKQERRAARARQQIAADERREAQRRQHQLRQQRERAHTMPAWEEERLIRQDRREAAGPILSPTMAVDGGNGRRVTEEGWGPALARWRALVGLSHGAAARAFGVSASTWYQWLRGEHEPAGRYQPALHRALRAQRLGRF